MPWPDRMARSAYLGGILWALLAGGAAVGFLPLDLIPVLFLLAPLVVIPLGLRLLAQEGVENGCLRLAALLQPPAALLASASFFIPVGPWAAAVAAPWAGVTAFLALAGLVHFLKKPRGDVVHYLAFAALLFVPVGGGFLVASRAGMNPGGFTEPIVLLTAVHFHFTGFAAPLLVALAARAGPPPGLVTRGATLLAAAGLVAGTPLLAVGFVFSPPLKLGAVILLVAALWAAAFLELRAIRTLGPLPARLLLALSAASLIGGMALAGVFEVGLWSRTVFLTIPQMAKTHGLLNGLGFAGAGLLAWTLGRARSGK